EGAVRELRRTDIQKNSAMDLLFGEEVNEEEHEGLPISAERPGGEVNEEHEGLPISAETATSCALHGDL
ncbi:unnamed protein product, partial [Amoebophrya sp. A25]